MWPLLPARNLDRPSYTRSSTSSPTTRALARARRVPRPSSGTTSSLHRDDARRRLAAVLDARQRHRLARPRHLLRRRRGGPRRADRVTTRASAARACDTVVTPDGRSRFGPDHIHRLTGGDRRQARLDPRLLAAAVAAGPVLDRAPTGVMRRDLVSATPTSCARSRRAWPVSCRRPRGVQPTCWIRAGIACHVGRLELTAGLGAPVAGLRTISARRCPNTPSALSCSPPTVSSWTGAG